MAVVSKAPDATVVVAAAQPPRPDVDPRVTAALCVDLDGTLLNADLFWESLLMLLTKEPATLLMAPWWLLRGRAYAKRQVALRAPIDPATLPYRPEVLALVEESRRSGREVVLATAADEAYASAIASHLGVFGVVIASDGVANLSGRRKAASLEKRFGPGQFEYVGNGWVDVPCWRAAGRATLVAAPQRLLSYLESRVESVRELVPPRRMIRAAVRAVRPHQWLKNLLVAVPLVTSHRFLETDLLLSALLTFVAFSLCASAIYVANDLLDIQSDRRHPRKRLRPFASGELSVPAGLAIGLCLLVLSFGVAAVALPLGIIGILAVYAALSTLYSLWIKRQAVLDVFLLAGFYVLRIVAGGVATGIELSGWLLAFGMFLFLNLAFAKRYTELAVASSADGTLSGRSYRISDSPWLLMVGLSAGFMAVLVLALYAAEPEVSVLYSRPAVLMLLCPVLLFWITRMWFRAARGTMDDDPLLAAMRDPVSYGLVVTGALILLAAR